MAKIVYTLSFVFLCHVILLRPATSERPGYDDTFYTQVLNFTNNWVIRWDYERLRLDPIGIVADYNVFHQLIIRCNAALMRYPSIAKVFPFKQNGEDYLSKYLQLRELMMNDRQTGKHEWHLLACRIMMTPNEEE